MNALSPVPTQPTVMNCQEQMSSHDSPAAYMLTAQGNLVCCIDIDISS
jgi:hypothetical protein